jgi:uncharacterized membrane protein
LHIGDDFTEIVPVDGSTYTQAGSINDAGHIVGSYYTDDVDRGYFYDGTMYATVHRPGALHTVAIGINNADLIVGTYVESGLRHGFLLNGDTYTKLDYPGAAFTVAQGINDSGQITGLYQDSGGATHGFVLTGNNYTTVDPPGATFTQISGINNAGQLAGYFDDATGRHGFIATPMPNADFNGNGTVDAADYVIWRKGLGTTYMQKDYDVWRAHFGKTAGSGASLPSAGPLPAVIPEPFAFALVTMGVLGLSICAPRRQRTCSG